MAFSTGNPVEPNGSTDPRDLKDNAAIVDKLINSSDLIWPGRLGKALKTWAGIINQVNTYLESLGFEATHLVYVPGNPLTVARPTQLIDYNGSVYKVKAPASFPVVLTGTWATDSQKLVDVGDAALRFSLASAIGSTMVGDSLYGTVSQGLSSLKAAIQPENLTRPVLADPPADRTYALADIRNFEYTVNAAGVIRTVPAFASVPFPVGSEISAMNWGPAAFRVATVSGVTIIIPSGMVNKIKPNGQIVLKNIGTNVWAATGDLEPGSQYGQYLQIGDSNTYGVGSTPSPGGDYVIGYAQLLAGYLARSMSNRAVSASMVADQAIVLFTYTTAADFTGQIMLGTNDSSVYLDDAYRKDCFYRSYLSCLVWMGVADTQKVFANNSAIAYVGNWGTSSYGKINTKYSQTVGNTASYSFYGSCIYFQYLLVDGITGSAEVYVDGNLNGTINLAGPGTGTLLNPASTGGVMPATYRVSGLSEGAHTIQIKITALGSGSTLTVLDFCTPSKESIKPRINLLTIAKRGDSSTDARTMAYNALILQAVSLLRSDGIDIRVCDTYSVINPNTDLATDQLHFNDGGHAKLARRAALDF
ncbi:SGNH/GDSL hydrolase family protein [Pseudomonas yamanorum]|uniref:SGNH/GDSL hydrolase family protein n=1 Tax=Pseudomonas yamanorum TaxID=515393 RepID=A0AAJ3H6U3_9PSED|nr:SGNH/GDSL hydrolase family protein [Pseudomonas yamanorum]NWD44164.1 SGNH/GDSL hydrolase family protein [Pseudomonas yamanorum]